MTTETAPKKRAPRKKPAVESVAEPAPVIAVEPAAPAKKRTAKKKVAPIVISTEERHHLIEVAAYYIAERRGFSEGSHEGDWLEAEQQIDSMIAGGKFTAA